MSQDHPDQLLVTFWGTRGSIPTPGKSTEKYGGNTPCISVQYGDTHIVLDAGTGIRNFGLELMHNGGVHDIHLLLSHTHWDHIQGLPFFAPAYAKHTNLSIYGSPQRERFLAGILQGQMDMNYFPVEMNALSANLQIKEIESKSFNIGPVKVEWEEQVLHPGGSSRYRLSVDGKTVVYATDVELDKLYGPAEADLDEETRAIRDAHTAFINGADLLIADAQYTTEEYPLRKDWGHTTIPAALKSAYKASVKQTALFHHDPQHSDAMLDKMWKIYGQKYSTCEPSMHVFWAREGMTLAI